MILPMSDVQIRDDWRTAGMAGTGSHSTVAEDVALPAARAMPLGPLFGGAGAAADATWARRCTATPSSRSCCR